MMFSPRTVACGDAMLCESNAGAVCNATGWVDALDAKAAATPANVARNFFMAFTLFRICILHRDT